MAILKMEDFLSDLGVFKYLYLNNYARYETVSTDLKSALHSTLEGCILEILKI